MDLISGVLQRGDTEVTKDGTDRLIARVPKSMPFFAWGKHHVTGLHGDFAILYQMTAVTFEYIKKLITMMMFVQEMRGAGHECALSDNE